MKKITMKNPCPKKWENMQGDDKVRLCESCDRRVEDFMDKSVEEIIEILESRKERTCARVFSSQLNPVKKIAAAVLISGMLVGGSCSPKVSDTVAYINNLNKKKKDKEGYVIIGNEAILPIELSENGKVKIHIEGKVIDSELREPIIFANVVIEGGTIGLVTEYDGSFIFKTEISKGDFKTASLEVSYIGYKTISIPLDKINMKKGIEINMFEKEVEGIMIGIILPE